MLFIRAHARKITCIFRGYHYQLYSLYKTDIQHFHSPNPFATYFHEGALKILKHFLEYLHIFAFVVKHNNFDGNLFASDDRVRKIQGQEKWLEYSQLKERI